MVFFRAQAGTRHAMVSASTLELKGCVHRGLPTDATTL